ncbi:hypothetical protein [Rhizobium laguerreae]|uniref:hypothetical protein n=1 Tax=Rhizobium laguerreae TaxID=1076926 RepID=UPI0039182B98
MQNDFIPYHVPSSLGLASGIHEWLTGSPTFRIKEGMSPMTHGGHVFGLKNLILTGPNKLSDGEKNNGRSQHQ